MAVGTIRHKSNSSVERDRRENRKSSIMNIRKEKQERVVQLSSTDIIEIDIFMLTYRHAAISIV